MNKTVPEQSSQKRFGEERLIQGCEGNLSLPPYLSFVARQYPIKVLVAWGEAISGNGEFRDWLLGNGYPELGLFVHALHNQEARAVAKRGSPN